MLTLEFEHLEKEYKNENETVRDLGLRKNYPFSKNTSFAYNDIASIEWIFASA